MKGPTKYVSSVASLLLASPALAVDTSQTYHSGILVVGFLAFCALILVVQLLPALTLLFGWLKSVFRGRAPAEEKESVETR